MATKKRAAEPFVVEQRDAIRGWLEEALAALPELCIRRLFGGAGIYSGETIFGVIYAQRVYLKTDERTRASFVERGSEALRARSGNVLTRYYEVPAEVLDDEDELVRWARLALDVANDVPARPRRRGVVAPAAPEQRPERRAKTARSRPSTRRAVRR
jgi:DNA transformation protein